MRKPSLIPLVNDETALVSTLSPKLKGAGLRVTCKDNDRTAVRRAVRNTSGCNLPVDRDHTNIKTVMNKPCSPRGVLEENSSLLHHALELEVSKAS